MAATTTTATTNPLPKSGAVSKGYNFASSWEQVTRSPILDFATPRNSWPPSIHMSDILEWICEFGIRSSPVGVLNPLFLVFASLPAECAPHGAAEGRDLGAFQCCRRETLPSSSGECSREAMSIFFSSSLDLIAYSLGGYIWVSLIFWYVDSIMKSERHFSLFGFGFSVHLSVSSLASECSCPE